MKGGEGYSLSSYFAGLSRILHRIDLNSLMWFILGPSGVGKSSFGQYIAHAKGWLHLEIDQFPNGDGIDTHGLREPWDLFFLKKDPSALAAELARRVESEKSQGGVASFPGGVVLSPDHIKVCRGLIAIF